MKFGLSKTIRNNRLGRQTGLKKHMAMWLLGFLLAIGLSFLSFGLSTSAQASDEIIMYKYYKSIVIQKGDTLWGYAREYGNKQYYDSNADYIKEVMEINALTDHRIISGRYLILPYYSTEFYGEEDFP